MNLAKTLTSIKKSLARHATVYAEGRRRHRALASFDSPAAVLAAVSSSSPLTVEERDVIYVALLAELRLTKHTLWQSLLLVAFEPMLARVRARLGRPESEDLDERVFLAFLEAAQSLSIPSHAARVLRLALERKVYGERKSERAEPEADEFIDDTYVADPFAVTAREQAAAREVVRILEAEGGDEFRDLMLATRATEDTLRAYVQKAYADPEREGAYRRLVRARSRLEKKIRKRMNAQDRRRYVGAA
jgi:hypothetical protein